MKNIWVIYSSAMGGLGVALGAFGAHGLRPWLPLQRITIFETAVRYHMYHALALLGVALLMGLYPDRVHGLRRAAISFTLGILLFSGGLYGTALSDFLPFRYIVPVGGVMFIAGWCLLALAFWRNPDTSRAEK